MKFQDEIRNFVESNLDVVREDHKEFACFCPFHSNNNTPAFYINKQTGLFYCHNPDCGKHGRFETLASHFKWDISDRHKKISDDDLQLLLDEFVETNEDDYKELEKLIDRVKIDYSDPIPELKYLLDRGFTLDTLKHFEVGYSRNKSRVVIPVRDVNFKLVGVIGRAIDQDTVTKYLYSAGFKRAEVLFNLCYAKNYDEVIVVEGSLDALKIFQAGYPNVVATLGAYVAQSQIDLLNKYFDKILIFPDHDPAGEASICAIMEGCARKRIHIAQYPQDKKDAGELCEQEIINAIENKITDIEFILMEA